MAERGYLGSDDMSTTMNLLRGNDLIWHYVVNNYLLGKEPKAFDLLFWNAESRSVASSPALSATASQSASTQGRSVLAKSDST